TDGPLIVISSPHARKGEVWETYKRQFGPQGDPRILVAQAASRTMNSTLSQRVVDRALERDPQAASAEYLAQFRSDLEAFITLELIESAVDRGVTVRPPLPGVVYHAFTDPSGGAHDAYTLGIGH